MSCFCQTILGLVFSWVKSNKRGRGGGAAIRMSSWHAFFEKINCRKGDVYSGLVGIHKTENMFQLAMVFNITFVLFVQSFISKVSSKGLHLLYFAAEGLSPPDSPSSLLLALMRMFTGLLSSLYRLSGRWESEPIQH